MQVQTKITPENAARLEAAHERYVIALRRLNSLRISAHGSADYVNRINDAQKQLAGALADWRGLFETLTGRGAGPRRVRRP